MRITPPAINPRWKWLAAALWYVLFCILYSITGQFHLRPPLVLSLWAPDRRIPFLDWTIWIYWSQFALLFFCFLGVRSERSITRLVYSISLASLLSFSVFLFYPTTLPRDQYISTGAAGWAFRLLYSIDSASNCFPSLHVALAWLSALALRDERKLPGSLALVWAALISLSTLTTKQHYFVDLLGGGAVALISRSSLANNQQSTSLD
jgi:membrane-associated phospholipid phosphatase